MLNGEKKNTQQQQNTTNLFQCLISLVMVDDFLFQVEFA